MAKKYKEPRIAQIYTKNLIIAKKIEKVLFVLIRDIRGLKKIKSHGLHEFARKKSLHSNPVFIKYIVMGNLIYQKESYKIIGICMEVHKQLGRGFLEIVYKDALEYEFQKQGIFYEREKKYTIEYKEIILPHHYYADFVVFENIILEIKGNSDLVEAHLAQTINYLAVSGCLLGLIVNFGKESLEYKRVVL